MYQSRIRNNKKRTTNKELVEPTDDTQEFAYVEGLLGNGRLNALCEDGVIRMGRIRGSMRKFRGKVIIENGDLILISRRDYEDDKVDVIAKYTHEETSRIMKLYDLPVVLKKALMRTVGGNTTVEDANNEDEIVFEDDEINVDAI